MRYIFLTIALALLVVGCDNKTYDMGSCTFIESYDAGLAKGLKMAPPCDITNYGTYRDKCVGEYNSTTWTSCYGERTLPNGEKYRGGYLEGKANGKGEFLNVDGTRYLGFYEKGKRHGAGKEYDANGKVIKVGEWSNGVFASGNQQLQEQATTQENSIVSNNKEEGACYATLDWKAVKGQKIGIAFNAFITKNVPRFKLIQKQIQECYDSQGRLPWACVKSKLSSTDYDFFEGYANASVILDSPSDPNKMGNDFVLLAKYCYPLVKESLENKYGK
jgi:hypothetical protein